MTKTFTPTLADLVELAIEYGMLRSKWRFGQMNTKQQRAILKTIQPSFQPTQQARSNASLPALGYCHLE